MDDILLCSVYRVSLSARMRTLWGQRVSVCAFIHISHVHNKACPMGHLVHICWLINCPLAIFRLFLPFIVGSLKTETISAGRSQHSVSTSATWNGWEKRKQQPLAFRSRPGSHSQAMLLSRQTSTITQNTNLNEAYSEATVKRDEAGPLQWSQAPSFVLNVVVHLDTIYNFITS